MEDLAKSKDIESISQYGSDSVSIDRQSENGGQRVDELRKQRDELFAQILEHQKLRDGANREEVADAIDEFFTFFRDYNNYFWSVEGEAFSASQQTRESVLAAALDHTREMWARLSLAINQRFNPVYQGRLAEAGTIAGALIKQCSSLAAGKPPLIYFDKVYEITRYPYQSSPLLSLSLDSFDINARSALAHEIGHHIFWNQGDLREYTARMDKLRELVARIVLSEGLPTIDYKTPDTTIQKIQYRFMLNSILYGWVEEVFADIVGTLLVGPEFAKSAQDIIVRERVGIPADLLFDDSEHPMPAVRPFIAIETLRAVARLENDDFGAQLSLLCEELEKRWIPLWEDAVNASKSAISRRQDSKFASAEDIREALGEIVAHIVNSDILNRKNGSTANLIDEIAYWGKGRSSEETMTIATESTRLLNDVLLPVSERALTSTGTFFDERGRYDENGPFAEFLSFVAENPNTEKSVWEELLEFDLTLDRGDHTDCRRHGATVWHYHDGNSTYCC